MALHHDACICGACRSARADDARRLELAERSWDYSQPAPCGCGCGKLVTPGPTGQRYATNACRQRAYRRRRGVPQTP